MIRLIRIGTLLVAVSLLYACQPDRLPERSQQILPGDIDSKTAIVPCVGVKNPDGCGAAIYHTRHLGLIRNGMTTAQVMEVMRAPTAHVTGGGDGAATLCYSIVFGDDELRCFQFKNDRLDGFTDKPWDPSALK